MCNNIELQMSQSEIELYRIATLQYYWKCISWCRYEVFLCDLVRFLLHFVVDYSSKFRLRILAMQSIIPTKMAGLLTITNVGYLKSFCYKQVVITLHRTPNEQARQNSLVKGAECAIFCCLDENLDSGEFFSGGIILTIL